MTLLLLYLSAKTNTIGITCAPAKNVRKLDPLHAKLDGCIKAKYVYASNHNETPTISDTRICSYTANNSSFVSSLILMGQDTAQLYFPMQPVTLNSELGVVILVLMPSASFVISESQVGAQSIGAT